MKSRKKTDPIFTLEKLSKPTEPLYITARNTLVDKIRNGELSPGDRLPPDKELAGILGINHITLAKALNQLRCEGLVERYRKLGTFVTKSVNTDSSDHGANGQSIGLLFDKTTVETFQTKLFVSIHQALEASGHAIKFLSARDDSTVQFEQIASLMRNNRAAGCIVWSIMTPEQTKKILEIKPPNFPIVFLDRSTEGLEMDFSGYDDFHAGKILAEHLRALEYRDIYVPVPMNILGVSTVDQRLKGVQEVFTEQDQPFGSVRVDQLECGEKFTAAVTKYIRKSKKPVAIVALNDTSAIDCLAAVRQTGLTVPGDVVIGSFETLDKLARPEYDITAVCLPVDQMGVNAVKVLISRLNGDSKKPYSMMAKGTLAVRSSTDPLRGKIVGSGLVSGEKVRTKSVVKVGR